MKKILLLRFSSIGDIILTTPVIRWIKLAFPEAQIHYLTKEPFRDLLLHHPGIQKVYSIKRSIKEIEKELLNERYDQIIDLHNNIRSRQVSWKLRVPVTRVKKYRWQRFLLVEFKKLNALPLHVVERYAACLSALGISADHLGTELYLPEESGLEERFQNYLPKQPFVVLVPGAKHFTKRIPPEKIREIMQNTKCPIVLLGGKEEADLGKKLESEFQGRVVNACGKLRLLESAQVIKASTLVVCADTGLMHMASAFNKTIHSVWGGTVPQLGMTPWMPQAPEKSIIHETRGMPCRPCSKIGRKTCPKTHFRCMKDQDLTHLLGAIDSHGEK